jgi:hypothetical protein
MSKVTPFTATRRTFLTILGAALAAPTLAQETKKETPLKDLLFESFRAVEDMGHKPEAVYTSNRVFRQLRLEGLDDEDTLSGVIIVALPGVADSFHVFLKTTFPEVKSYTYHIPTSLLSPRSPSTP